MVHAERPPARLLHPAAQETHRKGGKRSWIQRFCKIKIDFCEFFKENPNFQQKIPFAYLGIFGLPAIFYDEILLLSFYRITL